MSPWTQAAAQTGASSARAPAHLVPQPIASATHLIVQSSISLWLSRAASGSSSAAAAAATTKAAVARMRRKRGAYRRAVAAMACAGRRTSRASDRHPAVGGRRQIEGRRGVLDDDATPLCPAHPAAHSIVFMANSITCEAHPIMQSMGLPPRRAASGSAGSPVPSATASTRLIRRAASSGLVAAAA
ncbi:hypothetical protein U9M48_032352 [Paspalum notatum var. saurae]|uniref:Uncharacterized protein n=1 Tax=Paspalum notatum var. saurae TaxID=547442 RepID=A0AAQ3U743_PASNO